MARRFVGERQCPRCKKWYANLALHQTKAHDAPKL